MSITGIFNVQDYGVTPGNSDNSSALQTLINNVLSATSGYTDGNGGTIYFPSSGTYKFSESIKLNASPASLIIFGTGQGTRDVPLLLMETANDLFVINNGSTPPDNNIGGIVFQDLQIAFATTLTSGAAIRVSNDPSTGQGSQNVRIFRVTFQECPEGVVFQNTLQGLVEQCTFTYKVQAQGVGVTVDTAQPSGFGNAACNEILIKKCDFRDLQSNECIGVAIYAGMHVTLENLTIAGLNAGILVSPTAVASNDTQMVNITDCRVGSYVAGLQLQPQSSGGSKLQEVRVVGSSFTMTSGSTYTGGGISMKIPSGGDVDDLNLVKLIGVTCEGWTGAGLEIDGGQNVQVIGGSYSGNGSGSAGVAITGAPANISIVGADLSAMYPSDPAQGSALSVSGTPSNVLCKSCTMFGYSASPVQVSGTPSNVQVIDCAGYNDQNTPLNGGSPPTASTTAATCTTPYYGPSQVTFEGAASVHTSGKTWTSFSFGSIYLPNPTDVIYFTGTAPNPFTWLGK